MGEYGTASFQFEDAAVRHVTESDIPAIINLFRLNYGEDYSYPQFYDDVWIKKNIYGESVIWLVIEEENEIIATGALLLDFGDYNDQIGEIGRVAVHPNKKGRSLGRRMVNALINATDDTVEFALGDARTAHIFSQALMDGSNFFAIGFLPLRSIVSDKRESLVLYANLYGNARDLRSDETPQVILEVAPLARHVLGAMNLPKSLSVVEDCPPYEDSALCSVLPLDRVSLAKLARIEHGRLVEPLLFGGVSLDQGLSYIRRRNAIYLMAVDENQHPIGALGYQKDDTSKIVKGIELVASDKNLRGHLCGSLLKEAERLGAQVIEVNVSAYDARIQQTFSDHGFHPVAYMPAMVFHGTSRLDVVKMLKLNVPYQPGDMKLTEPARAVVSIVEKNFL
jgi:N-acetylglutamate synthase-like GNAT family acetyltransferase